MSTSSFGSSIIPETKPNILSDKFHYVDGEFVKPRGDSWTKTFNPATGDLLVSVPNATFDEVDRAVRAADRVRHEFSGLSFESRAQILDEFADKIEKDSSRLAKIESLDQGKPLREAEFDMGDAVGCLRHFSELCRKFQAEQDKGTSEGYGLLIRWESIGVVGLIVPHNFPFLMAVQKIGTAIAAGCPMILKPSEYTSFTAVELAVMLDSISSLPKGAFNLVLGTGALTGNLLASHKLVRKISFTGSVATGSHLMKVCAERVAPVHLELGGKSALIVTEDCEEDLDAVVDWVQMGFCWNSGQVCTATSRLLVHHSLQDKLLKKLQSCLSQLRVGEGLDPETTTGPLVSWQQFDRVREYIRVGVHDENLKVLAGGLERPQSAPGHLKGFFVQPTVFFDVPSSSRLWKEEIFGPVLCVKNFKSDEEAIALANASEFGLGASVFCKNAERAKKIADKLEAGSVWVNNNQPVIMALGHPFGGFKQSGNGKELGEHGLFEYMQAKAIITTKFGHTESLFPKPKL